MKGGVGRPGGSTRLAGHGLRSEGAAWAAPDKRAWSVNGPGMGLCECGVMSEVLENRAARKRWHRAHKDEVRKS